MSVPEVSVISFAPSIETAAFVVSLNVALSAAFVLIVAVVSVTVKFVSESETANFAITSASVSSVAAIWRVISAAEKSPLNDTPSFSNVTSFSSIATPSAVSVAAVIVVPS